jgi:glycyl-tRNA synthetase beta chain
VSLADKLDTLARFFTRGMAPTGSKDPFALRRAGIGFLSLIIDNGMRCSFRRLLDETGAATSYDTLEDFLIDRLKVQQRDAGVRYDLIDAVFALGGEDDLVRLLARVEALQQFVETPEGTDLLAAYKRAGNILKKEKWDGGKGAQGIAQTGDEDPLVLVEEPVIAEAVAETQRSKQTGDAPAEEVALVAALDRAEPKAIKGIADEDFTGAMAALASLRGPIDAFFDKVTVNDPEPAVRTRRLNLLARFRDAVDAVADFSKVEG